MSIEQALNEPDSVLCARAAQAVGIPEDAVRGARIGRRSIDARKRGRRHRLRFILHVDLELVPGLRSTSLDRAIKSGRARRLDPPARFELEEFDAGWRARRVAVVGSGPAGLYAAWALAANGVGVDLIDRGPALRERSRALARFQRTRELDPERNLLFGEGGAGTYSDGKLYTRTQHVLESPILQTLVAAGAEPEIAFDARAHVGTDRLHRILPRLRERLEAMGVRFHFDTRLESLVVDSGSRVRALATSQGEIPCDAVVLALGHSARDTLSALADQGLPLEAKPFQLGLRIEHRQAFVDRARFGDDADLERLGRAYYALTTRASAGHSPVHSFCMCPGGQIVAAVAQPGLLCTNGMSNSKHSSPFANSGLVVTLGPREFGDGIFDGVAYQERLEALFFRAGGSDYSLPAQCVPDFLAGRASARIPRNSYKLGTRPARIDELLPESITRDLRAAIGRFDEQMPGYAGGGRSGAAGADSRPGEAAVLVGIESRSSGPLRMPRDPTTRLARGFENVFPVGEGAGYAGGIMSAAIDGARSAQALLVETAAPRRS